MSSTCRPIASTRSTAGWRSPWACSWTPGSVASERRVATSFPDESPFPEPKGFEDDDIPVIGNDMLHPEVEFEAGMSAAPPLSLALIAACAVAFGFQVARGGMADLNKLRDMGAMDPGRVEHGEVWRLLSATFLHGSFDHILGNMLMLYVLGMGCEHAFGRAQFLTLYVAAGLCGSLLSLTDVRMSVGASGAIFGLAGALVACLWWHRGRLHVRDTRIGLILVAWAGYQLFIGAMLPQVDNLAHLGGLLGGTVLGLVLHPAVLEGWAEVNARVMTQVGFVMAVLALVGTAWFFVPRLVG